MTPTLLRRTGRTGLLLCALLTAATFTLSWVEVLGGPHYVGFDIGDIAHRVSDVDSALTLLFLEIAPLPAYVAVLLSPTVGVRARWARIAGVILVVLAAALTTLVATGLYLESEPYPAYAAAVGVLAVLLVAAACLLALDRRGPYHGLVAALLFGSAVFQFANVTLMQSRATAAITVTPVPWGTAAGYLLAGLCVVVAAIGYSRSHVRET